MRIKIINIAKEYSTNNMGRKEEKRPSKINKHSHFFKDFLFEYLSIIIISILALILFYYLDAGIIKMSITDITIDQHDIFLTLYSILYGVIRNTK